MIERDESLTNLANEIIRVLSNSKTPNSELLAQLACVFEAGKEVLQSDSSSLATSWTQLYMLYLDGCTIDDDEAMDWAKLSRDMVSVRHLDHTRHCGAVLMSKLLSLNKVSPVDKDWGSTIGLLTSGTDILVEVALDQLVPALIPLYLIAKDQSNTLKTKETSLERHLSSLVSAALEVFSCERSHIKRLACLKFFGSKTIYSLLTHEAKQEFIILLKADLASDQSNYELQLEPGKHNTGCKTHDQLIHLVMLLKNFLGDQDEAIREALEQVWQVIKYKHPHLFIKLFCFLDKEVRRRLASEAEFRRNFDMSSNSHALWYHGGWLPSEFIDLLINKVPSGDISSLDYVTFAWPEGALNKLLNQITDHEVLYKFIQACIMPSFVLKVSSATLSWRPLLIVMQTIRESIMEIHIPRVIAVQNEVLIQQITEDFIKISATIFSKPLVTHMAPIQEEMLDWIAVIHTLSPKISLSRKIDDFMISLHDSGKKRESTLLNKLRTKITKAGTRFREISTLARAFDKEILSFHDKIVMQPDTSRKVAEIKVRSNSIGRGSSTGRSDTSLGAVRSHRRGGANAFQMNSSSGLRVPGLPTKAIKETSTPCTKCGSKGCKCGQTYAIPTPFQALNPQKSPPTPSHATGSLRGLASGSLVTVKLVQKPLTITELDPSSQSNSPVMSTPGQGVGMMHQSRFSIHLLSQPDTPTSIASGASHSGRVRGMIPAKLHKLKRSSTFNETQGIHQSMMAPTNQKGGHEVEQSYQDSNSYTLPQSDNLSSRRRNSSLVNTRAQTETVLKELSNPGSVASGTKPNGFQTSQPKKFRFLVSKNPLPATSREPESLPRTHTSAGPAHTHPPQDPKKPAAPPRPRALQGLPAPNENVPAGNTAPGPPKGALAGKRLPKLGVQQVRKDSFN